MTFCTVPYHLDPLCNLAADTYNHTDSEFLKSENNQSHDAGSTASTAVLVGDRLLVANVGDSRAVVCKGGKGESHIQLCFFCTKVFICLEGISLLQSFHSIHG